VNTRRRQLDPASAQQLLSLGQAIREARRGRHTLESLAHLAQISPGQLSHVENGRGNPTVEMLMRISSALDVDIVHLLEPRAPAPTYVVRADQRQRADRREQDVRMLTAGRSQQFSVAYVELAPGESVGEGAAFRGDHIFYILSGHVAVHSEDVTYLMGDGDSFVCRTSPDLRGTNTGSRTARLLAAFRSDDQL
jgi:transcriptional regulator with XRE-family HTH domain